MKPKHGFARTYFIIAIIFGLLGLVDSMLNFFDVELPWYAATLSILLFFFLILNITAIIFFHHHHVHTIAFVLPVYHIISYVLFVGLGIWIAVTQFTAPWLDVTLTGTEVVTSLFEVLFSFYVLAHLVLVESGKIPSEHTSH